MPFVPPSVIHEVYMDASGTGFGLCQPAGNIAIFTNTPRGTYRRELWAVLCAILLCPPKTLVRCDNQAVVAALTHSHGRLFSVVEALVATLLANKGSWIM